jgi:hypothetical protein
LIKNHQRDAACLSFAFAVIGHRCQCCG